MTSSSPSVLLGRIIAPIEGAMMVLACLAISAMVSITAVDVVFRYALNAPFSWSHDLTTNYLLIALFFLALPYVTARGAHMSLDFAVRNVREPVLRNGFVFLGDLLGFLLAAGIGYGGWQALLTAWQQNELLPGSLPLPTWPMHAMVLAGSAVLALRLLCGMMAAIEATVQGRIVSALSASD
jgi:TRAP-type C4-dicarboxylate transport system permease small subunit